jgi:deoxyuridine 5'-triphosphate nucleotidohydrolase
MDLFYCPDDGKGTTLFSQHTKLFQTGLKFEVPEGYMLEIKNKSSVASKRQLVVGACVVDSGYDGEVFVNLHNIGFASQYIDPGQKIAQAVLIPVSCCEIDEVVADDLNTVLIPVSCCEIDEVVADDLNKGSTRGDGALGSTGDR